MAQNDEPALLTNNPLVKEFYDNSQSNIIRINDDKLKNILYENKEIISKNSNFWTPLTLLISLVLTFCTNNFKDFANISANTWQAFYMFCSFGALIWLIIELTKIKRVNSIDDLINKIKNQTNVNQNTSTN
jgi:hypothetical protein